MSAAASKPGKLFDTGLPKYDIITGHDHPLPVWSYRINERNLYEWPDKHTSLDEAIESVNKRGGEVSGINPWPVPSTKGAL